MPPRSRRWAYGLFRNDAEIDPWHVWHSSPIGFATRCALFGSDLWTEWHVRQFTAAELEWKPVVNDWCQPEPAFSWQARQFSGSFTPWQPWVRLAAPPAPMSFAP